MAITNSIENFEMIVNESFIKKADALTPELIKTEVTPTQIVEIEQDNDNCKASFKADIEELKTVEMGRNDSVILDFGNHHVGYVKFRVVPVGSPPDAPAYLRIKFGEIPVEIVESSEEYDGDIGKGWIQEEFIHIDILPAVIEMPRRYAFRYMEVKVLDTSSKYRIVLEDVSCTAVSSGDISKVAALPDMDSDLLEMDRIALRTMQGCMQKGYEDGPKRDRRLWIGDLRLQAQTNYVTFHNNDLVKHDLYLYAGLTMNEGRVGACLFTEPKYQVDDTALFDYSLFFVSILYDYYMETKDEETREELTATAYRQIELAVREMDEEGVVKDKETWWCFIDWADGLNKQAGAQGILVYTLRHAIELAKFDRNEEKVKEYERYLEKAVAGAMQLWDAEKGFFVSGSEKQISWASQVWMVLADVFGDKAKNAQLLEHTIVIDPKIRMVTPYMYHHFIEALVQNDRKEVALSFMRAYWGEMVKDGADTFWELYDPADKNVAPYGSKMVNSYCHAWSCSPSYIIRKYLV